MRHNDFFTQKLTMVDLETTSANPLDACITSLSLVDFTNNLSAVSQGFNIIKSSYGVTEINVQHLEQVKGAINPDTTAWRMLNKVTLFEEEALLARQAEFLLKPEAVINMVLSHFVGNKNPIIIANHPEFDITILARYFYSELNYNTKEDFQLPWKHYNVFDLGSLITGAGHNKKQLQKQLQITTKHTAYDDCLDQINILNTAILG